MLCSPVISICLQFFLSPESEVEGDPWPLPEATETHFDRLYPLFTSGGWIVDQQVNWERSSSVLHITANTAVTE